MRTYHETESAFGAPVSLAVLDDWSAGKLIVARWVRQSAKVVRSDADAHRVVVNLGCEYQVRYTQADIDISGPRNPGDIAIVPAGPASECVIDGTIDVVEIFVDADSLGALGGDRFTAKPVLELANDDLRASAIGLFLAADGKGDGGPQAASATFQQSLLQLLASCSKRGKGLRGGLKPSTLRRIDDMIDAWLDEPGTSQPSVVQLAEVARLSQNHFIRAFRETTGTTPYQYVMARRRRHAMVLLRLPGMPIAEVSDRLGFSSPAHFIASFRRRFGVTPGHYRDVILDPTRLRPR